MQEQTSVPTTQPLVQEGVLAGRVGGRVEMQVLELYKRCSWWEHAQVDL
jgi:hypothetical protein